MQPFWKKASDKRLDLLGLDAITPSALRPEARASIEQMHDVNSSPSPLPAEIVAAPADGQLLTLPISALKEDLANPRAEFSEVDLDELAENTRPHGVNCGSHVTAPISRHRRTSQRVTSARP